MLMTPPAGALFFDNAAIDGCTTGGPVPNFPNDLGADPVQITLADIDGDALTDLVAVPRADGQSAVVVRNQSLLPLRFGADPDGSDELGQALALAWADSLGDSTKELIVLAADERIHIFEATETGLDLRVSHGLAPGLGPTALALADWNNDGRLDFLVTTGAGSGDQLLQTQSDDSVAVVWESAPSVTSDASWVDLDLDGDLDLLRIDTGQGLVLNENSLAQSYPDLQPGPGESPVLGEDRVLVGSTDLTHLALKDFDEDGDADIAVCGLGILAIYETLGTAHSPTAPAHYYFLIQP
jgi:hypothetical protein